MPMAKYLSHYRTQKNRVSPVSRASPAHLSGLSHSKDIFPTKRYLTRIVARCSRGQARDVHEFQN